ncbi:8-oxo-dGTP diphosphatase [invertebrate metagenome]|uniref:8-oxo-dGTP diphosphatase n=1 Tax=invertebrate metagenome TaxID=1711999 RepID=A0A2H9TAV7_9ZZZZ
MNDSSAKEIQVAVGVIIRDGGEFLLSKRPHGKYLEGLWEFPGGKIEREETTWDALKRELQEELDIRIIKGNPLMRISHCYPDRKVLLDTWTVTEFDGLPKGNEGQEVKWVPRDSLKNLEFPEANYPILKVLLEESVSFFKGRDIV